MNLITIRFLLETFGSLIVNKPHKKPRKISRVNTVCLIDVLTNSWTRYFAKTDLRGYKKSINSQGV